MVVVTAFITKKFVIILGLKQNNILGFMQRLCSQLTRNRMEFIITLMMKVMLK
jgi:hypothetical protein